MAVCRTPQPTTFKDTHELIQFKEVYPNDPRKANGRCDLFERDGISEEERWKKEAQLRYEHLPEEEQEVIDGVLRGQVPLDDLPEVMTRVVRVFISSTFTDMAEERNHLIASIYPKLRAYCRERYGVDFQAVDMRWGVPLKASDDHSITELCLEEIQNCRKYSIGPYFMIFLGQKYGYIALPAKIPRGVFEKIVAQLRASNVDVTLLKTWYKLDTNALDNVYLLQSISAILGEESNKWNSVKEELRSVLKKGLDLVSDVDEAMKTFSHELNSSVTELEINEGLTRVKKQSTRDNNCVVFTRSILNPDEILDRSCAYRFFDLINDTNDLNSDKFIATRTLTKDRVLPKVCQRNIFQEEVEWSDPKGIDTDVHSGYLERVGQFFHMRVRELIDLNISKQLRLKKDDMYEETLRQWHQVKSLSKTFVGREDLLKQIEDYIMADTDKALVVHGSSGYGKTALLAKMASQIPSWLSQRNRSIGTTVVRFCGTSPASSTIRQLLNSLCHQLAYTTDNYRSLVPTDYKDTKQYFKQIVQKGEFRGLVVIILDALNQLSAEDMAHKLDWLPPKISGNVKVIVSTTEDYNILKRLKSKIQDPEHYVRVDPLEANQCITLINSWLHNKNRMINFEQCKLVKDALAACATPLYTKLIFEEVVHWKSYHSADSIILPSCIMACIENLFEKLEQRHGKVPVQYTLSYLTASRSGLSKLELHDMLSIDDDVLNNVFNLWEPPIRRIPPNILPRIFHDISTYLVERETDETTVLYWYHDQFEFAATNRYLMDEDHKRHIHRTMADFFRGTWGGTKSKDFVYTDGLVHRLKRTNSASSAMRHVPEQPLVFDTFNTSPRYNFRKINQQPYHMFLAGMHEDLKREVYFNFEWLLTAIKACSVRQVITDLNMSDDKEVVLLTDVFRMSEAALTEDPNLLGLEISGRLLPLIHKHPNIYKLVMQCDLESKLKCPLVPNWQVFTAPGGPLQYVCEADPTTKEDYDINTIQCEDTMLLVAKPFYGTKMKIWDVSQGEPLPDMVLPVCSRVYPTPNGVFVNTFKNNRFLQTYRLDSGDLCGEVEFSHSNLGRVAVCNKYIAFTLDHAPSPVVIDIEAKLIVQRFQYQSQAVALSENDRFLLCNNGQMLSLHELPLLERKCMVYTSGEAEKIEFMKDPSKAYVMSTSKHLDKITFNLMQKKGKVSGIVHDLEMQDFKLSHNNKLILVRASRCLFLFDTTNDQLKHRFQKMPSGVFVEHLSTFKGAVFSQNDSMIVAARHTYLAVWDTATAQPLRLLQTSVSPIIKLYTSNVENKAITLLSDHSIQVWNLNNLDANVQHCNAVVRGKIASLDASSVGKRVICAGPRAAEAVVVHLDTGETERVLQHTNDVDVCVESVLISPSGKYAVTRIANTDVPDYLSKWDLLKEDKLWNLETGEQTRGVVCNRFVTFSSNDSKIVHFPCRTYSTLDWNIVSYDALIINIEEQTDDQILELPEGDIVSLPLLVDKAAFLVFILQKCQDDMFGLYLCVYSFEKVWKGVNFVDIHKVWTGADEDDQFIDVKCASDDNVMLVYGHGASHFPHKPDGSIDRSKHVVKGMLLYSIKCGYVLRNLPYFLSPNSDLSLTIISRNATILLDDKFQVFDGLTGKLKNKLPLENVVCHKSVRLLMDGSYVAAIAANRRELVVFSTSNGARKARVFIHGFASHLETFHDDKTLVVGCTDGRVAIFTFILGYADHVVDVTRILPSRQSQKITSYQSPAIVSDIVQVQNSHNEHRMMSVLNRQHIMDRRKKYASFKALSQTVMLVDDTNRDKVLNSKSCCIQ